MADKPNVIFIYGDDLGRGMLSCYGQQHFETPNIDRLANEGMRFRQAYGCAFCAPSRASMMTGLATGVLGHIRKAASTTGSARAR